MVAAQVMARASLSFRLQGFGDRRGGGAGHAVVPRDFSIFADDNFGWIGNDFQGVDRVTGAIAVGPGNAIVLDEAFALCQGNRIF